MRRFMASVLAAVLAFALLPAAAFADGAETVTFPSSEGVTNPAAKIELVDPAADQNFYLYSYDGNESLSFPSDDYPYYKDTHTVSVRLTGVDPTKECDDNITFFSGNECDIVTSSQDTTGGNIRTVTVARAGHGGPAPYTVTASSGLRVDNIFKPTNISIPSLITFDKTTAKINIGGIFRLEPSVSTVSYDTDNPSIATVSSAGVITGVDNGIATITATYAEYGLTLTCTCTVTVGTGETSSTDTATTATIGGCTYKVTGNNSAMLTKCTSSGKSATIPATVKIGDTSYAVTKVSSKAFKTSSVRTVIVKSKAIASFKNALKGSKVTTVKVPASKKAAYKKLLTKAKCGKSVKVK